MPGTPAGCDSLTPAPGGPSQAPPFWHQRRPHQAFGLKWVCSPKRTPFRASARRCHGAHICQAASVIDKIMGTRGKGAPAGSGSGSGSGPERKRVAGAVLCAGRGRGQLEVQCGLGTWGGLHGTLDCQLSRLESKQINQNQERHFSSSPPPQPDIVAEIDNRNPRSTENATTKHTLLPKINSSPTSSRRITNPSATSPLESRPLVFTTRLARCARAQNGDGIRRPPTNRASIARRLHLPDRQRAARRSR